MPNYNFRNVNTGVEWTDFMSMTDKDKLLEQNKDIKAYHCDKCHDTGFPIDTGMFLVTHRCTKCDFWK